MSLEGAFSRLRAEWQAELASIREEVQRRLSLIELRQAQLHQRVRLLEAHWLIVTQSDLDPARMHGLERSRWRACRIPPRPKLMKIHGVGVDPPQGEAACRMI